MKLLGFIGTIIVAVAYIPQIIHLIRIHCAYGINIKAWFLWLVAAVFILPYAWSTGDRIFIILQLINIGAITFILIFGYFHKEKECKKHKFL